MGAVDAHVYVYLHAHTHKIKLNMHLDWASIRRSTFKWMNDNVMKAKENNLIKKTKKQRVKKGTENIERHKII